MIEIELEVFRAISAAAELNYSSHVRFECTGTATTAVHKGCNTGAHSYGSNEWQITPPRSITIVY